MLHLQYILFEAISNALQHARAARMALHAGVQLHGDGAGSTVRITLPMA